MQTLIESLQQQFSDIRRGPLWMGENFETKLRRLHADMPFTRPDPGLHSPAELLAHLSAWRWDALLKIEHGKGRLRDHDEENWPPVQRLREKGWAEVLREFDESLEAVQQVLKDKDDSFLQQWYFDQDYGRESTYAYLIYGLLHHDLYHLGQLGIVVSRLGA